DGVKPRSPRAARGAPSNGTGGATMAHVGRFCRPLRLLGIGVAIGGMLAMAPSARAGCNVIPTAQRTYQSTLGRTLFPAAVPNEIVTIVRDTPVFDANPAGNTVSVTFTPVGGPQTVVSGVTVAAPVNGAACTPDNCSGGFCTCIRVVFPDTDAEVAAPADGLGLTGPAAITVVTGSTLTAQIDSLTDVGPTGADPLIPEFLALPPFADFLALTQTPGASISAAPDAAGNLFIPIAYDTLVQTASS